MCLANNFSKKNDALDPQVLHMMTFKKSMKTSYLVSTDAEQAVDKYILSDVLVCSIAEYFCELCRILTSPYDQSKYKQRRFRNALQQNMASRLLYSWKTSLKIDNKRGRFTLNTDRSKILELLLFEIFVVG